MDYGSVFAISGSGMNLERTRVEVAALNLANASTTSGSGESGFVPMQVVARAGTGPLAFAAMMQPGADGPGAAQLAPTLSLEPSGRAPRRVHEPGHPLADEAGFVSYPGVDSATEMMTLMSATRAYEANVAAMNTARSMALKALEIGGAS